MRVVYAEALTRLFVVGFVVGPVFCCSAMVESWKSPYLH